MDKPASKLERILSAALKNTIKPECVKIIRITGVRGNVVSGFLLTHCPVGERDNWKDFEARIPNNEGDTIIHLTVDGRRFEYDVTDKSWLSYLKAIDRLHFSKSLIA